MKNTFLALVLSILFLSGCATNYYVNEDRYTEPKNYEKITVYVTNPEHEAYEVLKKSEIYDLTKDSTCPNKLEIKTIRPAYYRCGLYGLAYVAQALTLGMLPLPDTQEEVLSYSINKANKTTFYQHNLKYNSRRSLWEVPLLPFTYSHKGAQAKTLSLSQREICETPECGDDMLMSVIPE